MKYALLLAVLAFIGCAQQGTAPGGEPTTITKGDDGVFGGCLRLKVMDIQILDGCLNLERHPEKGGAAKGPSPD